MLKKKFSEKHTEKKKISSFNSINTMDAEELLGVTLKERELSAEFKSFRAGFSEQVKKTMASAVLDKHNHGFMDPLIDANTICEKDIQTHRAAVVRLATADRLEARAKELKTVLEEEIAQKQKQLQNLNNKLDRAVLKYNKSTYEDEEDYEVFENIDDRTVKDLKKGCGFGPVVTAVILCCLCVADAVNLYTTFESIKMIPFAVQIIMVATSALLLQLLPFFCAKITGDLINTSESYKKRKTTGQKVLVVLLVTVFIALCSGLTAVRFQVLGEDSTSVSDITFSDTSQTTEVQTNQDTQETSGSEKGYTIFLTILMITTSVASFYLGFEDSSLKEIHILNTRINGLHTEINSKKAVAQRLEGYTKDYLVHRYKSSCLRSGKDEGRGKNNVLPR